MKYVATTTSRPTIRIVVHATSTVHARKIAQQVLRDKHVLVVKIVKR